MRLSPAGPTTILGAFLLLQSCSNPEAALDADQPYKIDSLISVEETQAHVGKNADELFEILSRELQRVTIDSVDYYVVEGDILMDAYELYMYCGIQLKNSAIDTASIEKRIRGNQFTVAIRPDGSVAKWPNGYRLRYAVLRK